MRMSFEVAVKQRVEEEENEGAEKPEPWLTFGLADQEFVIPTKPTPSQNATVYAAMSRSNVEALGAIIGYLDGILEGTGGKRIRRLLEQGTITWDLLYGGDELNEEGVVDKIMSLAAENPTEGRSDSSSSSAATGSRSTGRSPGRGSTRSN